MARILIVDDEDKYLELCRRFMAEHEYLGPARCYADVEKLLTRHVGDVDLVLLDVNFDIPEAQLLPKDKRAIYAEHGDDAGLRRLQRSQGLRILDRLRERYPALPVILMTAQDDLPIEADASRLQAQDYTYLLDDDYLDARSLKLQVDGIVARSSSDGATEGGFYWGETPAMAALRRRVQVLARGRLPVVILGETGTGKSLLARHVIHAKSQRRGDFVAADLSTIPHELMAAHLFGVVRGAFTGATSSRDGVLARADGGTLFLDEIGNLSLELQKSLLVVLQEGRYSPVGSVEERVADVKLVVATNEDLAAMVGEGRFREDLYMRLNPSTAVTLPALRDRRDDFDRLLEFFVRAVVAEDYNAELLQTYAAQRAVAWSGDPADVDVIYRVPNKRDASRLSLLFHPSSLDGLRTHPWPGNFRQFEMVLSNLVTFTLVDLVERVERVEPGGDDQHPEVIPVAPRVVHDLIAGAHGIERGPEVPGALPVVIHPQESLNAVSCDVERQYLEALYREAEGDLSAVAERLLGDAGAGRKIQLRMNQLGIKLRALRRVR